MSDLKAIVVVDPLSSAIHYGHAIQQKGYRAVALISVKKLSIGLRRLQKLHEFQNIVYASDLDDAIKVLSRFDICAVIPGSDFGLKLTDELSSYYGRVGNSVESSATRVDKSHQKKALHRKGVATAWGIEIGTVDINDEILRQVEYPVVVKPCRGTGSRNVKICTNYDELVASFSEIERHRDATNYDERRALVEEYLVGDEYFVVTANLGLDGDKQILCFACYEKVIKNGSPSIYKNIRSLPLDDQKAKQAFSYVRRVNEALEVAYGINDVELKMGSSGVLLVEQNGRLPGALVPKLIEVCAGVNCYDLNLDIYLGVVLSPLTQLKFQKHFCICCLIATSSGVVEKIHGLEEVKRLKSFHMINLLVAEGDHVEMTMDFLSSWGMVYLVHESLETLQVESELVHKMLALQYQP